MRPCSQCGWPESTRPPPEPWWRSLLGRRRSPRTLREQLGDEDTTAGCLWGCGLTTAVGAGLGAAIGYGLGGTTGAMGGAAVGAAAGVWIGWQEVWGT